ncbi:putative quinone oxidoreductase, YhdH/YhfP family [Lentimicrobium saccharophilum]|uniref:Putative quinone oxidoreductase, YhdH/YhfP family n=1 Tax=Lentimicrobium saccharophilum TaxID=1678841 RepID=A0A0S7C4W2_9BACT|nr:YhdH/YhfP family quinone oxidoreductase [Lentimicrobium saccharophilum]GAP44288.1 putative quinone oxidoreductase, YhdH/YhfP family [Lentimicrobium saccharophilum]
MTAPHISRDTYFMALVTEQNEDGSYSSSVKIKNISELPGHDLLIRVIYSGLNYKDALSATGHKGITRRYPHTPGIDAAGIVVEPGNSEFTAGQEVIVMGYDLGMNTDGGFAEYIRVPASWVVRKPDNLSLKECMIIGTSGFTAASAVYEFINHGIVPGDGKVLVTGASGAVGSMAVAMLAIAGYEVVASSGKPEFASMLKEAGATEIIGREAINDNSGKGLLPPRWVAALDTVGGNTLSTVLLSTAERGIVANCGMIASARLDVPIFPFILRAVRLIGIASAETPMKRRLEIWNLISQKLKPDNPGKLSRSISLEEIPEELNLMLKGRQSGKIVVKIG